MSDTPRLISFKESIALGKYDPEYLSQYPEWQELDRHLQFQYISQAIINKRRQLRLQWANLANQPNFSKKTRAGCSPEKSRTSARLAFQQRTLCPLYADRQSSRSLTNLARPRHKNLGGY